MQATQYGLGRRPLHTEVPAIRANRTLKRTGMDTIEERASLTPRLTKRRQGILDFILAFREQNGTCPTHREICAAVGLSSTSTVSAHLYALCQLNLLRRHPNMPRAYVPVEKDRRLEQLELQVMELEKEVASRFQAGYEAGWKARGERLNVESSTDPQGYPQAASVVVDGR